LPATPKEPLSAVDILDRQGTEISLNDEDQNPLPTAQRDAVSDAGRHQSRKRQKQKKAKRPFMHGTREHLTAMYGLGRTLVEEPRSFPHQLKLHVLKWARATWNARGGGFYACGFVVTFIFLEIRLLLTELFTSAGATDFILAQLLQILLRFTVDSLVNTVQALIWPVFVLGASPIWGALGLAAGYLVFSRFAKERLTRLLFHDPGTQPMNADPDEK
jgi:hypothetical protein